MSGIFYHVPSLFHQLFLVFRSIWREMVCRKSLTLPLVLLDHLFFFVYLRIVVNISSRRCMFVMILIGDKFIIMTFSLNKCFQIDSVLPNQVDSSYSFAFQPRWELQFLSAPYVPLKATKWCFPSDETANSEAPCYSRRGTMDTPPCSRSLLQK